ncbi:MAG TPA: flagellar motor switch protein FliN [bacterium]|nr:flagellar motor switch protein FliN [bacterium]
MSNVEKLQAVGAQAAQGMGETLNSLLGREVQVHFAHVDTLAPGAVASALAGSYFIAGFALSGAVSGSGFLATREKDASIIADLLIGQDGTNAPDKMTELHLSAFGEVVSQLGEAFTQAVQKTSGAKVSLQTGEMAAQETGGVEASLNQLGPSIVVFSFGLASQGLLSGDIYFYLPESTAQQLGDGAGKPAAAKPAAAVQQGAPPQATPTRSGGVVMQQQLENDFSGAPKVGGNIALLMDVPLKLTVELGRTTKLVKEILALAPGSVVELDKLAGEAVDILVNEKLIAKGEVVVIDENFGVRITEIINPEERLSAVQS